MSESLTMRTVRGVAWTLSTTLASRVVGLLGTLLMARFLAPGEYGEVTEAAIFTITAFSVTTFGVGIYLLSNRDLTRAEAFHASCWFLATGVAALGLAWGIVYLAAPAIAEYMPLLVLCGLLDRIAYLPERMLTRKLRFRWLSIARAGGELAFTGTALGLAAAGHGAMSIVWASVARSGLKFLAIVPAVDRREWLEVHPLRREIFGKIIRFGTAVSLAGIASFLMRRWDNELVRIRFGHATMGAYNYAYNLADTPAVAIGEQMSDVVAASFPHADDEKRRVAVVRACTLISLIMFPLAFGLGAVAETVGDAFFNEKWQDVGPMLMLLAVLSAPRPLAGILHAYFYATKRPRVSLILEWVSLGLLMGGILAFGWLGIRWVCGVVGVVFVLRTLLLMWTAQRLDGIPLRSFLVPLVRPLIGCLVMVAAVMLARPSLGDLPIMARLAAEVGIGVVVYVAGAFVIFRAATADLLDMVRTAVLRRK